MDISIHLTEMNDDDVVDEGVVRAYRIPPELAECSIYLPLVSPKWIQSSNGSRHVRFMARRKILESATKPSKTLAVALGWLIPRKECQMVLSNMLGSTAASASASGVQVVEWSTPDAVTEGLERCILQAAQRIVYTREFDHHYRLWRQYSTTTTTAEERKEGDVSGSAEDEKENSEGVLHSSTGDVDESSYRKESAVGEGTQRRVVEPGPPLPRPQTGHAFALVTFTTDSGARMTDDDLYRTRNSSDFHTGNWDGVPEEPIESFDLAGNELNIDDRVLLLGLKTCRELNGRVGCIRRVIPDGRVEVDIADTVTSGGMRVCRRARLQSSKVQRLEPDQLIVAGGSLSPRSDDNVVGSGVRGSGQTLRRDTTVHPADISALWSSSNGPGAPQPPPGMPVIPTKPPASPPAAVAQSVGNPTSERETNPHAVEGRPRLRQLCDGVIEDGDAQEEDRSTPQRDATMDLPGAPPGMPTLEQLAGGTRRMKASSSSEYASLRGAARYRSRPVSEDTYRRRRSRLEEREQFQGHLNSIEGVAIPLPVTRKQMEAAEGSREQRKSGNNHSDGVPPIMPTFHDLHLAAAAADGGSQEPAQKEEDDASEDVSSVMDIIEDDDDDEHHPDGDPQQPLSPPTAQPIIVIGRNAKWRVIEKVSSYGYIAQLLPGRPLYDKVLPSSRRVAIRAFPITSDAHLSLFTDKLDLVLSKVSTNTPPGQQQPPPQLLAIFSYDIIPPQPALVLFPSPRGLGRPPLQGTVEKYVVVYTEWCPLGTVHDLLMDLRHGNSTDAAADIVLDEPTNGLEEALVRKFVWYTLVGLHWLHHHELYHGHLCSQALMLDGMDNSVKLEGYALPFTRHYRQPLPPLVPGMVVDNERGDAPAAAYWRSPELQGISPRQPVEPGAMAKGDIWSLGCLAIEMLTGTHPRYTTTLHQDISDIIALDDSAIPHIPSEVSDTGRDFIARCLQRNPHLRPLTKELMMHPWMLLDSTPRPVMEADGGAVH
ncbi:ATP binding [Perkinsus olseni]|uniref:ATP binding n=1 Tax=Perkinsus olseni TaxID=32597 RepID=A0A7J6M4H2_PEROL|nr:ATP binding [Perkinsus olseni]KAF4672249.1 ATP binding [Perkinsus olseni]